MSYCDFSSASNLLRLFVSPGSGGWSLAFEKEKLRRSFRAICRLAGYKTDGGGRSMSISDLGRYPSAQAVNSSTPPVPMAFLFLLAWAAQHAHADAIACAYRCDPNWSGLDNAQCYDMDECPSPDSQEVAEGLCWGLPYSPSPGDILLHDQVPFESQEACQEYIDSWKSDALQTGTTLKAGVGGDKTDFASRGQMWSTVVSTLLQDCYSVDSCKDLLQGFTGQQVQDCIDRCAYVFGEQKLEEALCDAVAGSATAGLAVFFCHTALPHILEPVNKFLNKYIEDPIVHAAESIQDASMNFARKVSSFFGFGIFSPEIVVWWPACWLAAAQGSQTNASR